TIGGDLRWQSEYLWCNKKFKSKYFLTVFKKSRKIKKKVTEKREFLRKTSFRTNRFFYMVETQNQITLNIEIFTKYSYYYCYLCTVFSTSIIATYYTADRYSLNLSLFFKLFIDFKIKTTYLLQ
ncbi:Uncharacterized protein FWK35_00036623, partial [Aphis craccivora]